MGHSSKKKKKGKGGRGRGRNSSKDHSSQLDENQDLINDELTALASMFQEDFKIISEAPKLQIQINLRPYSNVSATNVSATLLVRFLPGYPHKCPKLQINPDEGLSEKDANQLLSLLIDQANIYARDGREMIHILVEAAQEFLSEIIPLNPPTKSAHAVDLSKSEKSKIFVCSSIDLFSDLSGDSNWEINSTEVKTQAHAETEKRKNIPSQPKNIPLQENISVKIPSSQNLPRRGSVQEISSKLDSVAEENDSDEEFLNDSSSEGNSESENNNSEDQIEREETIDSQPSTSSSFALVPHDDDLQSKKKDLLLVHFLRKTCASEKSSSLDLPELSSELCKLGILSDWAKDLAEAPLSVFSETFNQVFEQQTTSSQFTQIFKTDNDFNEDNNSSKSNSRYLNDFEELRSLGHGGFGHVALCQNKLDGRRYAVKRIRLKDKNPLVSEKILREVATLSLLQHQHVVRYYQSWFETSLGDHYEESGSGSMTTESATSAYGATSALGASSAHPTNTEKQETTYLYIQMEYCPRTLRQDLESYTSIFQKEYAWHLFRQIVEGLAHIHSQGIIHRDLTPSNIFFDVRNDIKIGDFGLAKFLKLEQIDQEQYFPTNTAGVSMDGTGQVGTYFYTAPEIEQKWPQINEKVDMYSLGVIFFELWHPFATAMERHIVLSDLKLKGTAPNSWIQNFPAQSVLLNRLMAPSPSDRPSAIEVLQHELPPRMEDEWLNDVLRMIQAPEDNYVYDRVVSTIFNEERLINKINNNNEGQSKIMRNNESIIRSINEVDFEFRDVVCDVSKEVFKRHCAKKVDGSPLRFLDGTFPFNRKTVKLMNQGGNILELCHELRSPFALSIASNQITSFKRYEIEWVYRRAIGRSTPNRFLQGDFDIVGGEQVITEAEVIKVAIDITSRFFNSNAIDIRLNHGLLLESIWSWVGIPNELRQNVAELLSLIGPSCPKSTSRKSNWKFIRRQLLQDLHLSEGVVDKLQAADVRFCGSAENALARLRGALSFDVSACKALEDLSALLGYLRTWYDDSDEEFLEKCITIDVLMPPSENYYTSIFFQMYVRESNPDGTLIAIGGRYDQLVEQICDHDFKSNRPGAVGVSIALEKFLHHPSLDIRPSRSEPVSVLVCSRGGGGLLGDRMEFVSKLWDANIRADFVPISDPSLKDQYEYASEHDFKCLVIITESDLFKVRQLELKKEKELPRAEIVKFLSDAISSQFRNLTIWG
ncbi:hypothetical protein LUZ60_004442 [Juncus effusus]|nr:hypothetical protein LUZ60_004442 [Juncus effusus]